MFQLVRKTHRYTKIRQHTYIFPNQISKQCMHSLHSIVHKTVNKQDPKRVRLYIHKILYHTTFRYLFYYSFCFHAIPVVSKYRKPVQLPWTGFLNLQMFKSVLTWKPVFSDTPIKRSIRLLMCLACRWVPTRS